jgi:hypothetical protein
MKKKDVIAILIFSITVITVSTILSKRSIKRGYEMSIDFKVDSVYVTLASKAEFFNVNKERLISYGFVFYDHDSVKKGDNIFKERNSDTLYVYRMDSLGNRNVVIKKNLFSVNFYGHTVDFDKNKQ